MRGARPSLVLLALLAGCAAMPAVRAVEATGDAVTYEYPAGERDEAQRRATLYCANLGRTAVLRRVLREGLAEFECR